MNWSKQQLLKMKRNIHRAVVSLEDDTAAETPEIFPAWAAGCSYQVNDRLQFNGLLYKVLQDHTSQEDWTPDQAASLYAEIPRPGTGTHDDPIRYNGNMELQEGLYYTQAGQLYLCFRSSEIPVYNDLADLVGIYVQAAD